MTEPLSQVRSLGNDGDSNTVTAIEYITTMLAEMDRRYEQRFNSQTKAEEAAFDAQAKVLQAADLRYQQRFEALASQSVQRELRYQQRFEAQALALDVAIKAQVDLSGEADRRYQQRFEAQNSALGAAFLAQQTSVQSSLAQTRESIATVLLEEMGRRVNVALEELDKRYQQRYEAQTKAVDAAFLAQQTAMQTALQAAERAVQAALQAAKEAVGKAEVANEKRFESVQEFRAAFGDQTKTFITRPEHEALRDSLHERIRDLTQRADRASGLASGSNLDQRVQDLGLQVAASLSKMASTEGRSGGMNASWVYLVGAIGVLSTIVGLVLALRK